MSPLSIAALAVAGCIPLTPSADQITARDLVGVWPALESKPPETPFGFAPSPGVQRRFTAAELLRIARRLGLEAPSVDLCVERPTRALEPASLLAAMQRELPAARIEVLEWSRFSAPDGEPVFPRSGLRQSGRWEGYIVYGKARRFMIWAKVKASMESTKIVAVSTLRAGVPIEAAQIRTESIHSAPLDRAAPLGSEEVIGRVPRRAIPAGALISRALLAEAPDIRRGDTIQVEVRQGEAHLKLSARAEADGRRGERIPVRNPETKRIFSARVEGKGLALAGPEERK